VVNLVIYIFHGHVDVIINVGHECLLLTVDALYSQTQLSQLHVTLVSTFTQYYTTSLTDSALSENSIPNYQYINVAIVKWPP